MVGEGQHPPEHDQVTNHDRQKYQTEQSAYEVAAWAPEEAQLNVHGSETLVFFRRSVQTKKPEGREPRSQHYPRRVNQTGLLEAQAAT